MQKVTTLYTTQQLEELLGKRYFYRQSLYRLAEDGKIASFQVEGTLYFSSEEVIMAILTRLAERIRQRFPWLNSPSLRIKYDPNEDKIITLYGFSSGRQITADTENETEEDLINKLEQIREEVIKMPDIPVRPPHEPNEPPPPPPPHGHHPPPPHHREIMDVLRRIEEKLSRIEERLG